MVTPYIEGFGLPKDTKFLRAGERGRLTMEGTCERRRGEKDEFSGESMALGRLEMPDDCVTCERAV